MIALLRNLAGFVTEIHLVIQNFQSPLSEDFKVNYPRGFNIIMHMHERSTQVRSDFDP